MKIFLITLILFTSLCAVPAYAETDLKIAQIDMFPSGAKFIFEVAPDAQKNFQAEIPGAFDADSIRLVNPNSARDFKALVKTRDDWTPDGLKALKAQILSREELIANLNSKKAALEQTKNLLSEAMPKEADANNLLNYIKEAENLKLRTENELAELKVKLDDANKTLKRLKNDFNFKAPANSNKFIELTGTAINNKNLLIEAFTSSARWYPEYTMQLDTSTGEIKTNMYVKLSQRTGLDYNGLIIFHTKYPDESVSTPRVNPLRVGFKPKAEPKVKARAMGTANYAMPAMRAPDMRRS